MTDRVVVIREGESPIPVAAEPATLVVVREPAETLVVTEQAAAIVVTPPPAQTVTVTQKAPTVLAIASPAQGPAGTPGGQPTPVEYDLVAVSSWSVQHTFGYPPEILLIDELGEGVEVGATYPAADTVALEFPSPFTGRVILS